MESMYVPRYVVCGKKIDVISTYLQHQGPYLDYIGQKGVISPRQPQLSPAKHCAQVSSNLGALFINVNKKNKKKNKKKTPTDNRMSHTGSDMTKRELYARTSRNNLKVSRVAAQPFRNQLYAGWKIMRSE